MTDLKSRARYMAQREVVYARDGGRCVVCGMPVTAGSVHHRQGRGGPDPHRLSNLLIACGSGTTGCHGRIHAEPAWAYEHGYMVRRHGVTTTEDTPVLIRGREIYLTNGQEETDEP